MHRARWSTSHDCIHEDHIVIRSPSLDERERIPSVNFGFELEVTKPLRDHNTGLIIPTMPIPTADDLHIADLHITIECAPASISYASRSICSFRKCVAHEMHGS